MYLKTRFYFVNREDHRCEIDLTDTYLMSDNSVSPYIKAHDICPGIIPPRNDIPPNVHIYFHDGYYKIEDPAIGKALLKAAQGCEMSLIFDHEISLMQRIDSIAKKLMADLEIQKMLEAAQKPFKDEKLFKENVRTISLIQKRGFFTQLPEVLHARIAAEAIDDLNSDQQQAFMNRAINYKR